MATKNIQKQKRPGNLDVFLSSTMEEYSRENRRMLFFMYNKEF